MYFLGKKILNSFKFLGVTKKNYHYSKNYYSPFLYITVYMNYFEQNFEYRLNKQFFYLKQKRKFKKLFFYAMSATRIKEIFNNQRIFLLFRLFFYFTSRSGKITAKKKVDKSLQMSNFFF